MDGEQLICEWGRICAKVVSYSGVDTAQVNAFFSRLQPQAMSEGFLMLTADNEFIRNWVETHYVGLVKQALVDLNGIEYAVLVEVDPSQLNPAGGMAAMPPIASPPANAEPSKEGTSANHAPQAARTECESSVQSSSETADSLNHAVMSALEAARERAMRSAAAQMSAEQVEAVAVPARVEQTTPTAVVEKPRRSSAFTFENYVIGDSNRVAYSMAVSVAENPGGTRMNPLFIYGQSGLGKTHLIRAIENYIETNMPHLECVYVDAASFVNQYIDAGAEHDRNKQSYRNFQNKYEKADVMLLDDVQQLQGKKQTLDLFFQIMNNRIEKGYQVILSADRAPSNIDMDQRYISRFNSGGTFDIQPPEVETKLSIIRNFMRDYEDMNPESTASLSDEVQNYIAENSSSNIRELKSAVTKVLASIEAFENDVIGIADVRRLLEDHFSGGAMKKTTIEDIQKACEEYYRVSHADIVGPKRNRDISYARKMCMYLSREMLDIPFAQVGLAFGDRDHATVMYAVNDVESRFTKERAVQEEVETIKKIIRNI
ncbi:MAG: chromosomal replication initiator protein DnaA [Berryella intestinalis]|uniref:chromosomal replication initiator protein DnaA n=1 Tax=Berryella intestinalis TaxID=1531429 RepID=UPI002A527DAD|nr:chromosomal replication initiator protein DnaA [Berryella intestinalis]MDD7368984.1 chromosomal replication initiator protein DnaA [Berryella intestinalis]MDY3128977.1 chromosomal replication initiator protein DnaA [Berryella intestinalis]